MAVKVDKTKCTGCGACMRVCPMDAIKLENGKAVISDDCAECGACINACRRDAIDY